MSGAAVLGTAPIMDQVSKYLSTHDLLSLRLTSKTVADSAKRELEIRKETELNIVLGQGSLINLVATRRSRIAHVRLIPGVFDAVKARTQLMRVRHLQVNLSVNFNFEFTDEVAMSLTSANIEVNELRLSSRNLWTLQTPIHFEDIKKLHVTSEPDVYSHGLLRLLGGNRPLEIVIPADYLDFPEVAPIVSSATKLTITEPRRHTLQSNRLVNALGDLRNTLSELHIKVGEVSVAVMSSAAWFPVVTSLSVTGTEIHLMRLSLGFPSLETLELRHATVISSYNTEVASWSVKKLSIVIGSTALESCSALRPLFPAVSTIEISGYEYTSSSLSALFRLNSASRVTIRGEIICPDRFDSCHWIRGLKDCRELRIVPDVWFGKLPWAEYKKWILKLKNLQLLQLRNFEGVTPISIKAMMVEDSYLKREFPYPWNCVRSSVRSE